MADVSDGLGRAHAGQAHHFYAYAPGVSSVNACSTASTAIPADNRIYGVIERRLAEHEWIAADQYDCRYGGHALVARSGKQGVEIENYPHLKRWRDTI